PDTGVLHGGVITATLDNASGWAVRGHEDWFEGLSMATLDIRIDYMRPAEPLKDLIVQSECYKMTKTIAFVRGMAHQEDLEDPVATSVAAFMLGTPNTSGRNL
ncbi:MAG TPA: PaaI family thioesterase, partial [Arenicellales bacterium]|nr:PaaI family thioesterase [Arenicellales bacterium]